MYGRWMALTTVAALGLTWGTAAAMGASNDSRISAATAMAIASILTFAPALLRIGREHFGVAVLFCGGARGLAALAIAYMIAQQHPNDPHRAMYMGIAAGAIFVLVVETVLTIQILSAIERRREAMKAAPTAAITQSAQA
jgi:hypothetical protein